MNVPFTLIPANVATEHMHARLRRGSARRLEMMGERMALRLFRFAATHVRAYKQFLRAHGAPTRIRTINDFKRVPQIDKKSYVMRYPMPMLVPYGNLGQLTTVSTTSGSTGEPVYFPRGEAEDRQYEYVAELFLRHQFRIDTHKTLGVIGFGLGIWIGGIFTYKNCNKLSQKGYPLTLAPVGTNKKIFLKTVKDVGKHFDQVLLMGYPPFIKDVLDEGPEYGIRWKDYRIKIITATEAFSEPFREYIAKVGRVKNLLTDILNIYGSVEFGTMAHETPLSVLIRRLSVKNRSVFAALFPGATLIPTLAQYHPYLVYFEEENGEVFATGYGSGYPLVRYRFHDRGGVIPFDEMVRRLREAGFDLFALAKDAGITDLTLRLPFVYVYERSDFALVVRGANIYPEHLKNALQHRSLARTVTGKFTMIKKENKRLQEYFEVHVELKKGVRAGAQLVGKIRTTLVSQLCRQNTEFNYLYTTEGKEVAPIVRLHRYEDPTYFGPSIKQKWVIK